MKDNFERALAQVLKYEGGYVNHPKDPGGATNLGITIAVLAIYRGRKVTTADVKALTRAEAAAIYRKNYWDAVRGDLLPSGLDFAVFDFAVNSGVSRAAMALQRAVGVADDGKIGPKTLRAARTIDTKVTVARLCADRLSFLSRLSTWPTFGKGWKTRVASVEREGIKLASVGEKTNG